MSEASFFYGFLNGFRVTIFRKVHSHCVHNFGVLAIEEVDEFFMFVLEIVIGRNQRIQMERGKSADMWSANFPSLLRETSKFDTVLRN